MEKGTIDYFVPKKIPDENNKKSGKKLIFIGISLLVATLLIALEGQGAFWRYLFGIGGLLAVVAGIVLPIQKFEDVVKFQNWIPKMIPIGGILVLITLIVLIVKNIMALSFITVFSGVIVIIVGLSKYNQGCDSYLSGKDYDDLVKKMFEINKIDIENNHEIKNENSDILAPLSYEGYKFDGAQYTRRDTTDLLMRSNIYETVSVVFTKDELQLYKVSLDTVTGNYTETSCVLFYKEIVSITTKNEIEIFENTKTEYTSLLIASRGGDSLIIAIRDDENREKTINAVRDLIKSRKIG